MKKFFQQQREILALIVYAGIILALIYLAIIPLMKKIGSINYQIQEDSVKQEIANRNIGELPKIQAQFEILQNSGDLNDVLLDKEQAVVLIEKLEELAQKTNNAITISVQENVDNKKVSAKAKTAAESTIVGKLPSGEFLQFKIDLMGNYDSIVKFIKELEDFEYYGDIIGVKIDKNEEARKASSSVSVGIENPFLKDNNIIVSSTKTTNDALSASLDVVFYTKIK